jgi:hypothetical protein
LAAAASAAVWVGGCVSRMLASASAPTSPKTTQAARPSAGCTEVARKVTSTGPNMNTTSSTTASSA